MNNTDLMTLLKKVNENNVQRKYFYIMGGIIVVASIGFYFLNEKNKKITADLISHKELNNDLVLKTKEQYDTLLRNENHIKKLVTENQELQRIIVAKQNPNPVK